MPTPFALITTGGTIDAEPYREAPRIITPLRESVVPRALQQLGCEAGRDFIHYPYLTADSKYFLTEEQHAEEQEKGELPELDHKWVDMKKFIEFLLARDEDPMLITHGSDALVRTACSLYEHPPLSRSGRRVILTCAMVPLARSLADNADFSKSDGVENLQKAVDLLQGERCEAGVHLVANRGAFHAANAALYSVKKAFDVPDPARRYFYQIG